MGWDDLSLLEKAVLALVIVVPIVLYLRYGGSSGLPTVSGWLLTCATAAQRRLRR